MDLRLAATLSLKNAKTLIVGLQFSLLGAHIHAIVEGVLFGVIGVAQRVFKDLLDWAYLLF